jgi:CheY-like chemotaxis protein
VAKNILIKPPIPEIFITAYAKEEIYQKAKELNVSGYIEKPFDIKTLQETVKKAIDLPTYQT